MRNERSLAESETRLHSNNKTSNVVVFIRNIKEHLLLLDVGLYHCDKKKLALAFLIVVALYCEYANKLVSFCLSLMYKHFM